MNEDATYYDATIEPDPETWVALDEGERILLVSEYHRQLETQHPNTPNPRLHAAMHCIVENQLAENKPPATRAAIVRCMNEGLDRHEAVHAVASVVSAFVFEVMKNEQPFDEVSYCRELDALTVDSWRAQQDVQ